jgi:hypothetical protein
MTNGTIVNARNAEIRQVFMEADFLPELRRRISEGLEFPVNRVFYEAERNSVRIVVESFLTAPLLRTAARTSFLKRAVVHYFNNLAWLTGTANSSTVEYKANSHGVARMRNPFDLDLMAAVVVGAFEALEKRPLRSFWKKENSDYLLRVEVMEEKPELSGRLEVDFPPAKEGDYRLRTCPRCGLPIGLKHLEWRGDEGVIIDRRRDIRMINLDGYAPYLVSRELVRELGDDAGSIIIEAEREYTVRMLKDLDISGGELEEQMRDVLQEMLSLLPLYGQGLATDIEYTPGGTLRVWVDNPYDEYLIAGRLAAFYEILEDNKARVDWSRPEPSSAQYLLTPM